MSDDRLIRISDVHMTKKFRSSFVGSFSEEISSLTICSPYFDKLPAPFGNVIEFCRFVQTRNDAAIQIITGPPSKRPSSLPLDDAHALAIQDVEIFVRTKPYLHAKLYHIEYVKGYFRSFVGSSNFTIGGLEGNDELMVEMIGSGATSPLHREITRLRDLGSLTFQAWLARSQPAGEEEVH